MHGRIADAPPGLLNDRFESESGPPARLGISNGKPHPIRTYAVSLPDPATKTASPPLPPLQAAAAPAVCAQPRPEGAWAASADKQAGRREEVTPGLSASERDGLARLRRENKQLRLERDILSKAAAWFARETGAVSSGSSGS